MKTLLVLTTLALLLAFVPTTAADGPICYQTVCTPAEDEDPVEWLQDTLEPKPCHCPPPGNEPLPL